MDLKLKKRLNGLKGHADSLDGWQQLLGTSYTEVREYLYPYTGTRASTYPCPVSGARLTVCESGSGYLAFATEDEAGYVEDVELGWEDVQMWRLDSDKLPDFEDAPLTLERIDQNVQTMMTHTRNIPSVLNDLREAQSDPIEHALSLHAKMLGCLTPEQQRIYEAVKQHGEQKAAFPKLKKLGLVRNLTHLNREYKEIKKLMENNGAVLTRKGPAKRHEEVFDGQDEDGKARKTLVDPDSHGGMVGWAEDRDCREGTLRAFETASEDEKPFYMETYPDIESEYKEWKKGK